MKKPSPKDHYRRLRTLSCEELWDSEVPAFDRATATDRLDRVAVVRAIGVVFSESGTPHQRDEARAWLRALLGDPEEKIRRYAMAALPKIGAGETEEAALLDVLDTSTTAREKQFLGRALEKIGGAATLAVADGESLARAAQKASANVARQQSPGAVRLDAILTDFRDVRIHLRVRSGLESIVEDELHERGSRAPKFRLLESRQGLLALTPADPFSLGDLYTLRCFSAASFLLGTVPPTREPAALAGSLAAVITSPLAQRLLRAFTDGPIRYRLEFPERGHQRGVIRALGDRIFALAPHLLNDSRQAPWQIDIREIPAGHAVELSPKWRPDPRFAYRVRDVPAASHPPLAACLARLAGPSKDERVWDPFCGSGLELIERGLRGSVQHIFATDLSAEAVEITARNLTAAGLANIPATLTTADFRDYTTVAGLTPGSLTLIITNPPLGRRVPISDLRGLIDDVFAAATILLRPGGRLVLTNPLPPPPETRLFHREFRERVDLGGFHCHVEKYVKVGREGRS